jgi:hypothetical protein
MNGGFGPGLGISSPLMGGGYSHSTNRLAIRRSHTSSRGSHHSDRIQPHPPHYGHPRPNTRPGPVGTIAPGKASGWSQFVTSQKMIRKLVAWASGVPKFSMAEHNFGSGKWLRIKIHWT